MKVVIDFSWVVPLFNSNFFGALITFLSVLTIIFVYKKQKEDEKEKAARIILSEIADAEDILTGARTNGLNLANVNQIIKNDSWNKYKHLFAKDLTERELKLIDNFYTQTVLINLELKQAYNLPHFWREKAQIVAAQHMQFSIESKNQTEYDEKKKGTLFFEKDSYWWQPNAPTTQIIERIKQISYVSSTNTYDKLNAIAYPLTFFEKFYKKS